MRSTVIGSMLLLHFLCGCSTPLQTGYLSDYEHLERGEFLEGVYADQKAISSIKFSAVHIGEISVESIDEKVGLTADEYTEILRDALLSQNDGPDGVVLFLGHEGPNAVLDVAITEMSAGSAVGRMYAAYGFGHAFVQFEGVVTNGQTGGLLLEFVERRRSSAALGLRDLVGEGGEGEVRRLISKIAHDVRAELIKEFDQ